MPRVFYLHWNEAELAPRIAPLRAARHELLTHSSTGKHMRWPDGWLPDAVVISIDRLPSHGRAVAEWVWEAKKRQHIRLIFAGGQPDKVAATRAKFPKATFCETDKVTEVVQKLLHPDGDSTQVSQAKPKRKGHK